MYLVYLPLVWIAARPIVGSGLKSRALTHILVIGTAAVVVFLAALSNVIAGMIVGVTAALVFGLAAFAKLRGK